MSNDKNENPHPDSTERSDHVATGEGADTTPSGGGREGFLDKVKEFFTGAPERNVADDETSGGSGWDGSDEPPELAVPENEAARAHTEATAEGEGGDAYDSRHGGGVDDSGVLVDAPLEDESDADASSEPDEVSGEADPPASSESDEESESDAGQEIESAEEEAQEREQREEEFAREHDPSTHDAEAGEEFRQSGDWVADEQGGPQVQEPGGVIHDPGTAEAEAAQEAAGEESGGQDDADEVRDGGHGWGSAAPVEGGAMPLGHPVKAWHDTMTFVLPGEDGYEGPNPHEWFVDAETAQRAGFRHAHGG